MFFTKTIFKSKQNGKTRIITKKQLLTAPQTVFLMLSLLCLVSIVAGSSTANNTVRDIEKEDDNNDNVNDNVSIRRGLQKTLVNIRYYTGTATTGSGQLLVQRGSLEQARGFHLFPVDGNAQHPRKVSIPTNNSIYEYGATPYVNGNEYEAYLYAVPRDNFLCDGQNDRFLTKNGNDERKVALFLKKPSSCSYEKMIRNAKTIGGISHLLVYNYDYSDLPTTYSNITVDSDGQEDIGNPVGIVFLSYYAFATIQKRILQICSHYGSFFDGPSVSPFYGEKGSENLIFPITLGITGEIYEDDMNWSHDGYDNQNATATFPFMWLVYFVLLLVLLALLYRTCAVWQQGGGGFRWRRTETGRIVGIRIIRPMPYWWTEGPADDDMFTSGQDGNENGPQKLTEKQVFALPEFAYEGAAEVVVATAEVVGGGKEDVSGNGNEDGGNETLEEQKNEASYEPTPSSCGCGSGRISINGGDHDDNVESQEVPAEQGKDTLTETMGTGDTAVTGSSVSTGIDAAASAADVGVVVDATADANVDVAALTTTCTACSICIDEFEKGETLRLIPRCRHAFHTECIMPWLTERSACCPLCKDPVLSPSTTEDNDGDEEEGRPQPQQQ